MTVRDDFPDGLARCAWVDHTEGYRAYHDDEWGRPVGDDGRLFEQLCLEGFQAGLSWRTILVKREAFRKAFAGFDMRRMARFGDRQVEALLADAGIVRHRGKIEAVIHNARRALELQAEQGSLAAFLWRYEAPARRGGPAPDPVPDPVPAEARALSRDLKARGWKFVGPTTMHAFMQAVGMLNDHHPACCRHADCEAARARFRRPG